MIKRKKSIWRNNKRMILGRKVNWFILSLVILIIPVFVLTGCNNPPLTSTGSQSTIPSSTSSTQSTTPIVTSTLSGGISEVGSTTVQPIAEKLAAAFMVINPKVKVDIKGGGTAVGIKAAYDGTADIGAASRELTRDDPNLVKFMLARDGIAIIVNPANPVNSLTKAQIVDIFSGKITNWSQVGGADKDIHVAAREEGSGTRTAFQELVMGKDASGNPIAIVKNAILQNSSGAIIQVVKSDAQAISFDSFGYVNNSVKALAVDGIAATMVNAKSGSYSVVRPLYFLTKNEPTGIVKAFIDYCAGSEAQKIITDEGYISVQ
jgi:phosphate transport system substrate-binding protein